MAVIGSHGVEDHGAVEHRLDLPHALLHPLIPQLQTAAPSRVPFRMQVHDDVETAVEPEPLPEQLVGVDLEVPARLALMKAAVEEVRVAHQPRHPRQLLEKPEELRRM